MTIFEDDDDRIAFLRFLKACSTRSKVEIHAYCLMSNHYHLLVRDDTNRLSDFCRNLSAAYATHFNERYGRTGPLFQSRFRSEPIKDDAHYLTVLRYIVQNPLKAGLGAPDQYRWSSYAEYGKPCGVAEPYFAAEMLGGLDALRAFLAEPADESYLDVPTVNVRSDAALRSFIRSEFGIQATEVICLEKRRRDEVLVALRSTGFSLRQIERVAGVSRSLVQKVTSAHR